MNRHHVSLQSLITFRNSQGDGTRGTLLKLDRASVVFEVYNPYSIVQLSEVLADVVIRRGERVIYRGRAVVSNLVNTGLMLIVSARLIDSWTHVPPLYNDVHIFKQEAVQFIEQWEETGRIRDTYRIIVGKLCSFLKELNQWFEQVEANGSEFLRESLSTYDALNEYAGPILQQLSEFIWEFEKEAAQVQPSDVGFHKAFLQRELHPLIMLAPFLHRTYYKPLGYAGDYEMMNMIHREEPEGSSVYAKIVNAAYVGLPIARCVRNRAESLEQYLRDGAKQKGVGGEVYRVLSVGCGPAVEMQRFVKGNSLEVACSFDLIDFNDETLHYASNKVRESIPDAGGDVQVTAINKSVHSLLKAATSQPSREFVEKYDFVYCAGLFDYLGDKVCARLVRLFYSWLAPNGVLLVTNMHERQSNRYVLEHVADWYLIYRNERQMLDMIPGQGTQRVFTDDTGINLCLEVRKADVTRES